MINSLRLGLILVVLAGCQQRDDQALHPNLGGQVRASALEAHPGTFVYPRDMEFTDGTSNGQPPPLAMFPPGTPPTISVASWNIEKLGHQRAGRGALQYRRMADMINRFDVIVVQEVMNPKGAELLANAVLGPQANQAWGFLYTKKQGSPGLHVNAQESVMFFWKRAKIELLRHGSYVDSQSSDMNRSPYWAHFRTRAGSAQAFDFILVGLHTKPGEVSEITYLGGLYPRLQAQFAQSPSGTTSQEVQESAERDILIAGDFNAGVQPAPATTTAWDREFSRLFGPNANRPPGLTKAIHQRGTMRSGPRANDNLMWDQPTDEDFAGDRNVVTFADEHVSDHYPVYATFHWAKDHSD